MMGKIHYAKSSHQKDKLEKFFKTNQGPWKRSQVLILMQATLLTRQQVYKWLWDKKKNLKKMKQNLSDKNFFSEAQVKIQKEGQNEELQDDFKSESLRKVKSKNKRVFFKNFNIEVPENIQQATTFMIPSCMSKEATQMLKQNGWKMIRELSKPTLEESMINQQMFEKVSLQKQQEEEFPFYKCKHQEYKSYNDLPSLYQKIEKEISYPYKENEENQNIEISYESPINPNITIENLSECQNGKSKTKYFEINQSNSSSNQIFESSEK